VKKTAAFGNGFIHEAASALPGMIAEVLRSAAVRQRFLMPPVWTPEIKKEPRFFERTPADDKPGLSECLLCQRLQTGAGPCDGLLLIIHRQME
jgi:hypothetical protein